MVNRLESCLRQLVEKHPEQSIILVTHGGVLDILYRRAMGRALTGPRDRPIPNAGLNWLELTVAGEQLCWAMLSWGETTHLEDASRDEIL
jgi:probable phosphoglycerate mutase